VQSCNFHIRGLRHIRQFIDKNLANTLACLIVGCRLDCCNALLYGMTQRNFSGLQRLQNSFARLLCEAPYRSSSQPLLKSLHWLPDRTYCLQTRRPVAHCSTNQNRYLGSRIPCFPPNCMKQPANHRQRYVIITPIPILT
jgi:hypothetical protein